MSCGPRSPPSWDMLNSYRRDSTARCRRRRWMPSRASAPTASTCWGLINSVLDIAKIESGRFTLNMTEYAIESVVETVRSATESLAQNKKLALKTEVAKPVPVGDE